MEFVGFIWLKHIGQHSHKHCNSCTAVPVGSHTHTVNAATVTQLAINPSENSSQPIHSSRPGILTRNSRHCQAAHRAAANLGAKALVFPEWQTTGEFLGVTLFVGVTEGVDGFTNTLVAYTRGTFSVDLHSQFGSNASSMGPPCLRALRRRSRTS